MATTRTTSKKTTKTTPVDTEEIKNNETTDIENGTTSSIPISVNADELIKSILNNVNTNNNSDATHSKEYIMCRSVTNGGLNINCKSGNVYEFDKYGSDCEIEYHDLAALVRKHSDHIFVPRIIIEDSAFIAEFPQLEKVYEKIYTTSDIEEILNLPVSQMSVEIKKMPKNVFENLRSLIATKIADGSIDSVRRIRTLSEIYDSDFNLLSELFSK